MPIDRFQLEYAYLSNFFLRDIIWQGRCYPANENAFQASKTSIEAEIEQIRLATPGQAKRLGHKVHCRPDWDKIKLGVMFALNWKKFTENPDLREKLLATGDEELIEGNYWHDTYWGVCNGVGQNWLGRILMRIRQEIREGRQYTNTELCSLWVGSQSITRLLFTGDRSC